MSKKFKQWDIIRDHETGDTYLIIEKVHKNKYLPGDTLVNTLNLDKGWFLHNYLYDLETEEPKFDKIHEEDLSEVAIRCREYYLEHNNLVGFNDYGK